MALPDKHAPIEHLDDLTAYLASGCKPESEWKLGTEHEKFGFTTDDHQPLPYDGERSIHAMLSGLQRFGWQPVEEEGKLIALKMDDGCSITLEPGGQLELSGALLDDIHQTCNEVNTHLKQVREVAEPLGIGFLGMGFHPSATRDDIPWMPKPRYRIMRRYMPEVGGHGHDMMKRTCTVQVNLDFGSEADMVQKFRVSLALQPVATALFANSPFTDGQPNGYLSYRSWLWEDTDPDRTGMLPFVFDNNMGFERYRDYMLDVPMYFVYRDGQYIDAAGQSFRDFLAGRLPALPGEKPTMKDWEDHLTTAFPEVRLKKFLEMRGADGGPWHRLCALPALWVGLLYHQPSLDAAWDLVRDWSVQDMAALRLAVPGEGLSARIGRWTVQELALRMIDLARDGLNARGRLNTSGDNESGFLAPLQKIAEAGRTPAEHKLQLFHDEWNGSVQPVFKEFAY